MNSFFRFSISGVERGKTGHKVVPLVTLQINNWSDVMYSLRPWRTPSPFNYLSLFSGHLRTHQFSQPFFTKINLFWEFFFTFRAWWVTMTSRFTPSRIFKPIERSPPVKVWLDSLSELFSLSELESSFHKLFSEQKKEKRLLFIHSESAP